MLKLEGEIRAAFDRLSAQDVMTKDDVRNLMAVQKREVLVKHWDRLRCVEAAVVCSFAKVDYRRVIPKLVPVQPQHTAVRRYCRIVLSAAPFTGRVGRDLWFWVVDERTGGLCGLLELNSDLSQLGPRERFLGWGQHSRYVLRRMNNVANIGTCICVAPFGWLTGGKFMIYTALSRYFADIWQMRYGDALAAITTTSLYGRSSQYNRIPGLEYVGNTPGRGIFHLDDPTWRLMKRFLRANHAISRANSQFPHMNKFSALCECCRLLKIDADRLTSQQPRGVYVGLLGDGAREYLQGKTSQLTLTATTAEEARQRWMERWYRMRLPKKIEEIEAFDYSAYQLSHQMAECNQRIRAASIDGDALDVQSGEGGSTPPPRYGYQNEGVYAGQGG